MFRPLNQAACTLTRSFSVVIVVSLILVPWAMLVGDAASGDACVIDSEGYCIFTGAPHENGLQPSTDQIVDRDGNVLFTLDQAVAVNSQGEVLQARGTPAMDGDRLIQSSLDGLTDDEKAFHRVMATMFPIRNALMYDIAETTQTDWDILVEELSIRQIKETTYTGGPTPKDNYYGRQGVFDLAKDPAGKDIHHEVMKFLEESGIYLLCHVTSDEFNQMLKDTHPGGHDPCDEAGITTKMPFTPPPTNISEDSIDCTQMVRTAGDPYIVDASLGDDMFPGTAQCPLLTIQRAADLMSDNEVVEVRSGVYHEEVVVSDKSNITFRAVEGDRVVLDGSQDIEEDLNATWQMYQDGIYRADLNVHAWQLFIDHEEMMPARWPNASFADGSVYNKTHHWAHGTIDDGPNYSNGELIDAGAVEGGHEGLITSGIDPVGAIAVLNVGSFRTWSRNITSFNDTTGMIGYDPVPSNEWKTKHHDYFLQGKLELLDAPGEWFFDAQNKTLFLIPLNGEDPTTLDVRVKTMAYAFTSDGGDRVIIEGMEFFASTFRFSDCDGCAIIDSHLQYPSTSKRSRGIAGEDPFDRWTSRFDKCSGCSVERSAFVNTDGTALEMTGGQNTVNNSQFYNIDWSASDLKSIMTTIILGNSDNVFTNNTIQTTGASATLNPGNRAHIAFNDISDTGHLQSDGAMVQLMQAQQSLAHVHHNWLHDSAKYGIRMDGPAGGINAGRNASVHHNVAWNVAGGIMVKGDSHNASNNTVFGIDHDKNNIIVLAESGGNLNSSTHNNAADKISGHRTKSVESYPVPGDYVNNFNGYSDTGGSVESQLIDPMNHNFCPKPDSAIAVQGAGAYSSTCTNPWTAGAAWELITPTPHIMGCTSENSSNHNPLAVFDDDSCKYPSPQTETGDNKENETDSNQDVTLQNETGDGNGTSNHTVANSTEDVPESEEEVDDSTSTNSVGENEENQTASGRREAEQSSGVDLEVYLKFGGAMCATGIILGFGMFLLTRDD